MNKDLIMVPIFLGLGLVAGIGTGVYMLAGKKAQWEGVRDELVEKYTVTTQARERGECLADNVIKIATNYECELGKNAAESFKKCGTENLEVKQCGLMAVILCIYGEEKINPDNVAEYRSNCH